MQKILNQFSLMVSSMSVTDVGDEKYLYWWHVIYVMLNKQDLHNCTYNCTFLVYKSIWECVEKSKFEQSISLSLIRIEFYSPIKTKFTMSN